MPNEAADVAYINKYCSSVHDGVVNCDLADDKGRVLISRGEFQPGDTLWDLAQANFGDPQYWPQLWSINEYITNPHWIYPGNQIVFTLDTLLEPPTIELETDDRGATGDALLSFSILFSKTSWTSRKRVSIISQTFVRSGSRIELVGS